MPNSETNLPQNRIHLFDPVSLINGGGITTHDHNHNDDNNNNNNPQVDLIPLGSGDQIPMYTALSLIDGAYVSSVKTTNEYGVPSPRLWRPNSPPTNPKAFMGSPLNPSSPKSMSPNSRTQAIARGRKELMEMVRDLPETFYELSLKDIVEKQKPDMEVQKEIDPPEEKNHVKELITRAEEKKKKSSKKARKGEKQKMARSKSVDNGKFLLKTSVFPVWFGSKKSKKSNLGSSGSFKIAPVPKPQPTPTRSIKGQEREWWRRRSCMSSESDESNGLSGSSTSSGSSRSSSRSNSNISDGRCRSRFLPSCCFFNGRSLKRIKDKK